MNFYVEGLNYFCNTMLFLSFAEGYEIILHPLSIYLQNEYFFISNSSKYLNWENTQLQSGIAVSTGTRLQDGLLGSQV
jgi:hypothetical protein